jgi:hypothetical protein
VCFAGIKEAEAFLDVVVPRHCEGEEEDAVFIKLRCPEEITCWGSEVHSSECGICTVMF